MCTGSLNACMPITPHVCGVHGVQDTRSSGTEVAECCGPPCDWELYKEQPVLLTPKSALHPQLIQSMLPSLTVNSRSFHLTDTTGFTLPQHAQKLCTCASLWERGRLAQALGLNSISVVLQLLTVAVTALSSRDSYSPQRPWWGLLELMLLAEGNSLPVAVLSKCQLVLLRASHM